MGNYRFRLSDMIPNAWFYKLKDMNKGRKQCSSNPLKQKTSSSQKPNISHPKYTYYFASEPNRAENFYHSPINTKALDTIFPESPRRSSSTLFSKKRNQRKTIYKPSPKLISSSLSSTVSNRSPESSPEPDFEESLVSESDEDFGFLSSSSFDQQVAAISSCKYCKQTGSSSPSDIIIDVNSESFDSKERKINELEAICDVELAPIFTKPRQTQENAKLRRRSSKLEEIKANPSFSVKIVKEERFRTHKEQKINPIMQRSSTSSNSVGIRLRTNSPRIASRKIQASARKSLSRNKTFLEGCAVVKSSVDPQKDFKDSMVEMIIENNIRTSKDLEDLLACYLSLNSKEYHHLIIKAFEQIWFDMAHLLR
ncbi:hypothetical protein JCGZ_17325 [Jatropha curcas]|uniref:Transcription repressor n=1 Tax=Jatropha curcas TaxID=180498 RepID=A0A067LEU3_JATCU|nr:transcription repressor OFP4 [Jatropha curcas]KDP45718.1 hypothetical protein JCGZ_17325 [Jatropha curcas]